MTKVNLKIGILGTRGIPNYHGGFEQFAQFFSVYLAKHNHEVYVYNSSKHPYLEKVFNDVNILHCYDPEDKIGTAGQFIYLIGSNQTNKFNTFFGFTSDYESGAMFINGDDAIELFENGVVIDVHGDIDVDGTDESWDSVDSWAYRVNSSGPDGSSFVLANWTFGGTGQLDGATNSESTSPFPIGTYSNTTAGVRDNSIAGFSTYPNPVRGNTLTVTTSSTDIKTVNIFNVLGRKVFSQRFSSMNKTMNVSEIASGVYIMKVSEGNNIATKKLIIE